MRDQLAQRAVLEEKRRFAGRIWSTVTDTVDLGRGGVVHRDYVRHPGAVAVMALNSKGEVYLVHQYRHPVRRELWEPPAGLLDVDGESPLAAAQRELHEEADLTAATWHVLADFYTSPGGSSETIRIYLARDLSSVAEHDRFQREAEELDMVGEWVPLEELLAAIAMGDVGGPTATVGALALDAARRANWETLRPADDPWTQRDGVPV